MLVKLLITSFILWSVVAKSQDLEHIYDPAADASADMYKIKKQAGEEKKQILIQVGGNWCIWCKRFYKLTNDDAELKVLVDKNYVVYHLNYSKENKNLPILAKLGYPQRFGFPVLVILDSGGNLLHTQNTALLESADGYDKKKVEDMLRQWSRDAFNPAHYQ